ncbi:hypothetical protein cypCar_00005752 [Cyprinus carpio]|nr:hypothetical protein cypCar_00005752 [Cyprinus carpio]
MTVCEKQFGLFFLSLLNIDFICYRIVLSLQRMLTLALEVDKNPTYNSEKISVELFSCLNTMHSCRQIRLLLLRTLDSKLLRCELLKMLLDETCSQPVSLNLLLYYLRSSTLASDPSVKMEQRSGGNGMNSFSFCGC